MDDKVIIFDTTLRDGEQAPGFSMTAPFPEFVAKSYSFVASRYRSCPQPLYISDDGEMKPVAFGYVTFLPDPTAGTSGPPATSSTCEDETLTISSPPGVAHDVGAGGTFPSCGASPSLGA